MPARAPERTAGMLLQHYEAREIIANLLSYLEGFESEHNNLLAMVHAVRVAATPDSNGRIYWTTEVPPGKAPIFRRALNNLLVYLRDRSHEH